MTTISPVDLTKPGAPQKPARRSARPSRRIPIDVAGKHGPTWGTVNVAGWLLAGAVLAVTFNAPWPWAPGFGFLGMCGALMVAATKDPSKSARYTFPAYAYRAVCWVAGSVWLTWVMVAHPDGRGWVAPITVLAGGAVILGLLAPLAGRRRIAPPTPAAAEPPATLDEEGERWIKLIAKASRGALNVKVEGIEAWESDDPEKPSPGKTIDFDMQGVSWRRLQSICDDLAALVRLPNGGSITAARGINRGRGLLHIATRDATTEEHWVPVDRTPLSVLNGLFVGWLRDGQELFGDIREATWMVIGRKGSGKTTWLNSVIAWLTRCTDCIVIVIDMNSGALGVPWARAYVEGRADHPAIEWLAGDPAEAGLVGQAMVALALGRKRRSGRLKRFLNVTLMPIGNGVAQLLGGKPIALPAEILIVVDEAREIFGDQSRYPRVRDDLMAVQALARDAGINLVISGLDGTSSTVSPFVKKQCEQRICLPVADEAEIAYVLDWNTGLKPEDMPAKGKGLAKIDGSPAAVPFGGPNMLPDQVDEHAVAVAGLRPVFTDEDLADIEGALGAGVFEGRWERARYLFDLDADDEGGPTVDTQKQTGTPSVPQRSEPPDLAGAMANVQDKMAALRKEAADAIAAREDTEDHDDRRISPQEYAEVQAFWAKTEELEKAIRAATDPVKRDALIDQLRAHRASALDGIEDTGMPGVEQARAEISRLNAAWDMPEYVAPTEKTEMSAKDLAFELLRRAGTKGASPSDIEAGLKAKGFSTVRQTVSDWFRDELGGRVRKLEYGRYAHRDAV